MKITLNNQIKIENPHDTLKEILSDLLRHANPKYLEAQSLGKSTFKIPEYLYNFRFDAAGNMHIPRGMRVQLFGLLNQLNLQADMIDQRTLKHDLGYVDGSNITYRPYQKPAVDKLLSTAPEGILVAPAGSGKTVMGMSLIPILMQPTLWLTHTDRLAKQSLERCKELLPNLKDDDLGAIGSGKWNTGNVLTIAMVQTLYRNLDKLHDLKDDFGLVILDEAHHCPASTFTSIMSSLNPYFLYGLTATAYRRDKLENLMFQIMGPVISEIPKSEVSKYKGIISPIIVYCPVSCGPIINSNEVSKILKNNIIYNDTRNQRIKQDVIREAKAGNFCIISSGRKAHCEVLYEMISKDWPRTGIATGKYSKKKIDAEVEAFNNNEITVLITTPELLGEGFDIDFLNRLFIATSFRTEARVEQLVGRVQRFHINKKDAVVYDYVDENIGVLKNQFYAKFKECRSNVYKRLGLNIIEYDRYINK